MDARYYRVKKRCPILITNFMIRSPEAAIHRCFFKIDALKNFAIFTRKHLYWSIRPPGL